ncbi:restriction endonuclease subunit S [Bacteroidales bacterium OttesenSCG-928-A17]|nr:restriction endonuclease subunit S [Bacteroidales bacterium OttesenSCG-928-A17]
MDTKKLRQKILDLAIRGKLAPQDPNDDPASVLIEKIRAEKERLIKEKKIKRDKNESYIYRSDKSYYEKFADGTVKCIDEEIPFEIPESWEWCRLNTILSKLTDGTHHSPVNVPVGDYMYITAKNIKSNGVLLKDITYVSKEIHNEIYARCNPEKGDILYIKDGATTGIATINSLSEPFSMLSSVALLKPIKELNAHYLLRFLQSPACYNSTRDNMKGVGITRVTLTQMERWLVPVAPLKEQEHIVEKIDDLFIAITDVDINKEKLSEYIKNAKSKILDLAIRGKLVPQDPNDEPASVLLERIESERRESKKKTPKTTDNSHYTFDIPESWVWCRLEDVCGFENGFAFSSNDYKTIGIPLIRISNIIDGSIELNNCVYIDESEFIPQRYQIEKGDLLIAMSGATTGKMGIYKSIDPAYLNQRVGCIKSKNNQLLSNLYRNYFLLLQTDEILKLAHGGAQPNISSNKINSIEIPLPPINEQRRIVKRIEEIFASLDEIANSIKA